ncbi:MAG: PTS sugar transporter subunit IIA, partial [Treponema sp.]|nr:PTS sugar transporter subunit IIA [Treponema sp.]
MKNKTDGRPDGEWDLATLVEHGGVHHDVSGANVKELVSVMLDLLPPIPAIDMDRLFREILEREALISTGVGRGIALPHPRNPMLGEGDMPLVAIVFPDRPIDWNTQDGSRVHTVFLMISSSVKQHLGTLSKINFLCQQER